MAVFSILNQMSQPTGLPITQNFTVPVKFDSNQFLIVSGSAYSKAANVTLTVQVLIEDAVVGSLFIWSNGANTHRAFAPVYIPQSLVTDSTYTLTLRELDGSTTLTDANDWFSVVLVS